MVSVIMVLLRSSMVVLALDRLVLGPLFPPLFPLGLPLAPPLLPLPLELGLAGLLGLGVMVPPASMISQIPMAALLRAAMAIAIMPPVMVIAVPVPVLPVIVRILVLAIPSGLLILSVVFLAEVVALRLTLELIMPSDPSAVLEDIRLLAIMIPSAMPPPDRLSLLSAATLTTGALLVWKRIGIILVR